MNIKVLSWNIWVNSHFSHVKNFLNNTDADIIGLQEVSGNDASRDIVNLLTNLGYNHVFFPQLRPWAANDRTDGPAIFTKFKIVESKKYVLSAENGVGAVQAEIEVNDKKIHVFSTHLTHTHQKDSKIQLQQAQEILAHIPDSPSILMGDFNAIPTNQTIQKVKETLLDSDSKDQPTWSVYPEGCEVCKPQKIDTRLDYIFTTKDLIARDYKVENSKGSDHLPISASIDL